nr:hypothetical protein [Tanacetum cinerariifolium]
KALMVDEDIIIKERTFKQMEEDRLGEEAVEGNASLSKTLLGDNVSEDNFLARMAALIKRKKQALAEKLAKERRNRWSMAYVKSFTDAQLKEEFKKIQKAPSNIQIQAFNRTLKRTGLVLEKPSSKQ